MTHYRSPMDWTADKARQAAEEIDYWANILSNRPDALALTLIGQPDQEVADALADDLNTSLALSRLQFLARYVDNSPAYLALDASAQALADAAFLASAELVGIPLQALANRKRSQGLSLGGLQAHLSSLREAAMASKDFSAVDALKSALIAAGVEVRMSKAGVELVPGPAFDPAKLEALP
jgi:cysteinyl-tRNA synthetase